MTDKPQVPAHATPSESLEAAAVAAYLEANPDFFVEHEELLPALRIPHQRGDTVSLVERQMKILRERNIEMRHRLSHLMTDQPQPSDLELPADALEAATVAAYLEAHPDFFNQRDELLLALRIPHQRGDTISLVERQLELLRGRNIEMRHRLSQLMDVARDNDRLFEKTRRLNLALMDATSLEELVMAVEDSLRQDFQVPFVSLVLFGDNPMPVGRWVNSADAQRALGGLLAEGKAVSGSLREHELDFLFGEEQRKQIGSTAVVALNHLGLHGVLAVGSRDPQHYKSSVGMLFLGHIAEVLGRVLPRFTSALRSVR